MSEIPSIELRRPDVADAALIQSEKPPALGCMVAAIENPLTTILGQIQLLLAAHDPFFTTKPTGTGLGLWVSLTVIAQHGGRLTAENRPERGAAFLVMLPYRKRPR